MSARRATGFWLICLLVGSVGADEDALRRQLDRALADSGAGRFTDAHANYARALELADREDRPAWRARVLRERGVTYLHQAAFEDARADFEAAIAIQEGLGETVDAAKTRLRLVSMLASHSPDEAERLLVQVEAALTAAGDEEALRYAELYWARLYVMQDDHLSALQILRPLREHYAAAGRTDRLADVLNLEAYALQHVGRLDESRTAYRDLIGAAFENGNQRIVAYAYCNLGDVEQALGAPQAAEANLDRAMDALDRMRAEIPGGVEDRMTYLDAQVNAYDWKITLLVDRGDPVGAFRVAERFHAKSLLEELVQPSVADAGEPTLSDGERSTLQDLIDLQRRLIRVGLDEEQETRLRELEKSWARLARERRRSRRSGVPEVQQLSASAVRERLPDGTAMLAYWIHPERSLLWVLLRDRVELVQIPIGRDALREKVERFLAPIRDRVRADDQTLRGGDRAHLELGRELDRLLIEPARELLRDVRHLIVVPDDHLWHLPFEALVRRIDDEAPAREDVWFADYARARYLLHEFSVLYAPSATVWARLADRGAGGEGLIAVAPSLEGSQVARERGWSLGDLPGARREATEVAALLRPGRALLGPEASEPRVKRDVGRYRFVHFATHGYLHHERPDLSGLFLWPVEAKQGDRSLEDGLFQGFEVRALALRAELVSLAACNSGLGQLSRAEGLVGVARAFLVAGSRNVLVSLWPVDDRASGSLVRRFYTDLQANSTLPGALRRAKLGLLDETAADTLVEGEERVAYAHPYFWATYVLIGGDTLERRSPGG